MSDDGMGGLRADPERLDFVETGIYVRAIGINGEWQPVDIIHLTKESLLSWLGTKSKSYVENVVLAILDFPRSGGGSDGGPVQLKKEARDDDG